MHCKVRILGLRGDHPWFEVTCPVAGCQKGVDEIGDAYLCNDCELMCQYASFSYHLQIDVTDGINIVIVAFLGRVGNKIIGKLAINVVAELGENIDRYRIPPMMLGLSNSTNIIELKSHTYMEYFNHETFTCSAIFKGSENIRLGFVTPGEVLDEYVVSVTGIDLTRQTSGVGSSNSQPAFNPRVYGQPKAPGGSGNMIIYNCHHFQQQH